MIKVGDKFNFKEKEWIVIDLDNYYDTLEAKDEEGNECYFMQSTAYKDWCQQQKKRADELEARCKFFADQRVNDYKIVNETLDENARLEKRWSELKDFLLRYEDVPQNVQSFETVFEYMKEVERIEEDGE